MSHVSTSLAAPTPRPPTPLPPGASAGSTNGNEIRPDRRNREIQQLRDHLDEIRQGPDLSKLAGPNDLKDVMDDQAVTEATKPNLNDNAEATQLKRDYREAYQKTEDGRKWAQETAEQYGPGVHELPDGTVVVVRENFDGETTTSTVAERQPDGSELKVIYNPEDPTRVTVVERDAQGNETRTDRNRVQVGVESGNKKDVYSLSEGEKSWLFQAPNADEGNPYRIHSEGDEKTATEANRDGSTDSRTWDLLTNDVHERHTPPFGGQQ